MEKIPLITRKRFSHNMYFVEVTIKKLFDKAHTGLMLVDTGATSTILQNKYSEYLSSTEEWEIAGFTGNKLTINGVLSTVIGKNSYTLDSVSIVDIPWLTKGQNIIGVLGLDFLDVNKVVLDLNDKSLLIK